MTLDAGEAPATQLAHLLRVLHVDLKAAIHEADQACAAVGRSLSEIASANANLSFAVTGEFGAYLRVMGTQIGSAVCASIVGLQYHDRLAQRIDHVVRALVQLEQLQIATVDTCRNRFRHRLSEIELVYRMEQYRLRVDETEEVSKDQQVTVDENVELF